MLPERDRASLLDILESARRALSYVERRDRVAFLDDFARQDAVLRRLEILGEAARRGSETTQIEPIVQSGDQGLLDRCALGHGGGAGEALVAVAGSQGRGTWGRRARLRSALVPAGPKDALSGWAKEKSLRRAELR